jgi:hypothetical protein
MFERVSLRPFASRYAHHVRSMAPSIYRDYVGIYGEAFAPVEMRRLIFETLVVQLFPHAVRSIGGQGPYSFL